MTNLNTPVNTIKALIETGGSRFTGVTFKKRDGSLRNITFQPARNATARKDSQVVVFDTSKKGYRTINLDTVREVRVNNLRFSVSQDD